MSKRPQLPRNAKRGLHRANDPEPLAPPRDPVAPLAPPGGLPPTATPSSREQSIDLPRDSVQHVEEILGGIRQDQRMTRTGSHNGDSLTSGRSFSHSENGPFGSDSPRLSHIAEELPPELSLLTTALDENHPQREELLAIAEQTRAIQAEIDQRNHLLGSLSRRLTEIHGKSSTRSPIDERSARTSTASRRLRASNTESVESNAPLFVYNDDGELTQRELVSIIKNTHRSSPEQPAASSSGPNASRALRPTPTPSNRSVRGGDPSSASPS